MQYYYFIANLTCIADSTSNECSDGDTRLVNGLIEQEGTVEVCVDGIWGNICGNYAWSVDDAYVTCVSLGYGGSSISETDVSVH